MRLMIDTNIILTRNQRDFADFGIALYSPEELISRYI